MLSESEKIPDEMADEGYIGQIPVRNLWLLMLYASELFRIRGIDTVGREDAPDDLPEIIAEILSDAVEKRQRRRLSLNYETRLAPLNRVQGRIDVLTTERRQLLSRGLVACKFDHLTIDTPRNRFVRAALERISYLVRNRPELFRRCRKLANDLKSMGVSGLCPTLHEIGADRFGHHDAADQYMVAAAKLAFEISIPTESIGTHVLPLSHRGKNWVSHLFEKAVGGFYDVVLTPKGWQVIRGKYLDWPNIDRQDERVGKILPKMQTDIILDNQNAHRRIVIDTKFTSILTQGWYRGNSIRSQHLYQIYAYLRSQVGRGCALADRAEGLLLHPSIGEHVDETVIIQGHRIRFMTVDLTGSTSAIRNELLTAISSD